MDNARETAWRAEKEEQIAKRHAAERDAPPPPYLLSALERAKAEIEHLRHENRMLTAIARTLDIFDRALQRPQGGGIAGADVLYDLTQHIASLKRETEARAKAPLSDVAQDSRG